MITSLYYLIDQNGDLNGAKYYVGDFLDLPTCQAQALIDGVAHYSVELRNPEDGTSSPGAIC